MAGRVVVRSGHLLGQGWHTIARGAARDSGAGELQEIDLRDQAVHPRIAGRRDAVASEARRGRRRFRVVALGVAVVLTLAVAVLFSPLFDMDHLLIEGVDAAPAAEVSEATGLSVGTALFSVHASDVRARIEDLAWVSHASVEVVWPDRVEVLVTPQVPVANVASGDGEPGMLATSSGRLLDYEESGPLLAFSGALPTIRLPGDPTESPEAVEAALLTLDMLGPATLAATGELTVDADGLILLGLESDAAAGAQVSIGRPTMLPEKAQAAEAVLSGTVETRCMASLDVAIPARITIERVPGCELPPLEPTEDR